MTRFLFFALPALAIFATAPAAADELLDACIGVVEVEGQPEGIAGCKCLVEVVDGNEKLENELLKLADMPSEERVLSAATGEAIGQCFALPEVEEDPQDDDLDA